MSDVRGPEAWRWFAAWLILGSASAFAFLILGTFALPISLIALVLLARHRAARESIAAVMAGAGLALLFVAFTNRNGPGISCTSTRTSVSCGQQSNPWPWLGFGVMLIVFGVGEFLRRQRSTT
jgi:hypothetical protein